jgi:hypothetical protein
MVLSVESILRHSQLNLSLKFLAKFLFFNYILVVGVQPLIAQ